jgi:hypothetical protein
MLYQGPFPQAFYRTLHRAVHSEFRMRRAWLAIKHDAPHPLHWRLRHLRLLASIPWNWLKWQSTRVQLNRFEPVDQARNSPIVSQTVSKA